MLLFLSLSLNFYVLLFELLRKKNKWVDSLSIFNVFFCLTYTVPFFMWVAFPDNDLWYLTNNIKINESWEVFLVLSGSYIVISISYFMFGLLRLKNSLNISYSSKKNVKFLIAFLFFIYAFLFLLSLLKYGSVAEYIEAGVSSRAVMGESTLGIVGYFRYVLNGMVLLLIIMLAYSWEYKGGFLYSLFVFLLFVMVVVFSIHTGGRGSFVNIFLILIFFHLYVNKVSKLGFLIGFGFVLIGFFYIIVGKILFFNIRTGRDLFDGVSLRGEDLLENTVFVFSYFKYSLMSIFYAVNEPDVYGTPRLGLDYIKYMLSYIPKIDVYENSNRLDVINQTLFNQRTGYVPPGWIAYSLVNGSVIWLVAKCVLISFIAYIFDNGSRKHSNNSYLVQSFYFCLFWIFFKFATSGDGVSNAQPFLGFYLLLVSLLLVVKFKRA